MKKPDPGQPTPGDGSRCGKPPREHSSWLRPSTWPQGDLVGRGQWAEVDAPGRVPALLALHGFGCTPAEVELLTDVAQARQLRCRAPLLPGHGSHARELAKTRYPDWFDAAEREFERLAEAGPVIVGGQSTGALLSLDLAIAHPDDVHALLLLASAVRLTAPYPDLALALADVLHVPDLSMPKFGGANLLDERNKPYHLTYDTQPMHAALSLRRAGKRIRRLLHRVHCPVFIAHGQHDAVCPVDNAWLVAERVATPRVELLILPNSAHIISKDRDRAHLAQRLGAFVDGVLATPGLTRSASR